MCLDDVSLNTPATVARILNYAAALIKHKGWTTGVAARDSIGNPVPWNTPTADSFCTIGAIARATALFARNDIDQHTLSRAAHNQLRFRVFGTYSDKGDACLTDWNDSDTQTRDAVVTALQEAAKAAEAS